MKTKKTKYMIVKTRREEAINEKIKAKRIERTDKYKYLGITVTMAGQLAKHIKELNTR